LAQAVKFTFASLLREDEPPAKDQAPQARMVPEAEIEAARAEAFEQGRAAGRVEVEDSMERSLVLMLEEVAAGTARMLREVEAELRGVRVEVAAIAVAVARKLSTRLLAQAPAAEIEALLAESMAGHAEEPRLVVRLDERLVDVMRGRLDPLLARQNFAGRVILIGEPGYSGADCRIEWPDGGVERKAALIDAAVEAAFARFAHLPDQPAQPAMSES
jgi:flagellar assembly protein FliH